MAATEIKMPSLGKKVKSVEVLDVKVTPGAMVRKGQPLLEVESDKGTQDFPSPVAGKVIEVLVKASDQIQSGQLVCRIESDGAAPAAAKPSEAAPAPSPPKPVRAEPAPVSRLPSEPPRPAETVSAANGERAAQPLAHTDHAVVRAGPATRHLARKLGVDLHKVRGTGRAGRITSEDVEHYVKEMLTNGAASLGTAVGIQPAPLPDFETWGEIEARPLSAVRQATAEHMSLCWSAIPHVTQHDLADITDLESFRQQQKNSAVKLTVLAFALKACAIALKTFPEFNSSLDTAQNRLILKRYYNIGVAVDTEHGLLVPVVRDVDRKSVQELAKALTEAAEAARNRKANMSGGTFTISNLGGIGGTGFTPIVNWPEVAILGLSRSRQQPVVQPDGAVAPRLLLPLSLSYDHRVIDGAAAARFTRFVAELLENPWKMLLHA
jgi:pyruvate dehydrogenase E2 component (dihydrolipoamide acetyltransferase)